MRTRFPAGVTAGAVFCMAAAAAGCGGSGSGAASATAAVGSATAAAGGAAASAPLGLIRKGTLTLCSDVEYPPMEYFQNGSSGSPVGFDVDLANAVGRLWGVKVDFRNQAFDGILPSLNGHRCDAAWSGMYLSPVRQKVADGVRYLKTGPELLVRAGNPKHIGSLDDLSGKKLAVQTATYDLQVAQDLAKRQKAVGKPPVQIQAYPKTTDGVQQVKLGRADAFMATDVVVAYYAKQDPRDFGMATVNPKTSVFAVFVNKGSALGPALRASFAKLRADGTMGKLAAKHGLRPDDVVTD